VDLAPSKISYSTSLILNSKESSQFSTAPSQIKWVGNGMYSLSLEIIPSPNLANYSPALAGKNFNPNSPSKQSPKNSHTLGAFCPLERIVNND